MLAVIERVAPVGMDGGEFEIKFRAELTVGVLQPETERCAAVKIDEQQIVAAIAVNIQHLNGADGGGEAPPNHQEIIAHYGIIGANNYNMAQFKNFIKEHPFTYIKLTLERIVKYFSFIRPMGFWFYQTGWSQFIFVLSSVLASVFLFTFGFAGIFAVFKKERQNGPLIYLIVFAFLTCASVIPVVIETRYRLPIYPFTAIFAGFFIARMLTFKKEYWRYLVAAFLILFFSSTLNIVLEYNKIIEKLEQFF